MIPVLALAVAMLTACGIHFILGKSLFRMILGFSLLGHAANLIVLSTGGEGASPPVLGGTGQAANVADPLPQALVLTAIVISMAVTLYLLALLAGLARKGLPVSMLPPPTDDGDRDPAEVAAELRGREEAS